jgi:1-deoxy-D-xylulose 5-phosphate reductoisomerase
VSFPVEHGVDDEVGRLLDLLQQRMECGIQALIITRSGGRIVVAMPSDSYSNSVTWDFLEHDDWHGMRAAAEQAMAT